MFLKCGSGRYAFSNRNFWLKHPQNVCPARSDSELLFGEAPNKINHTELNQISSTWNNISASFDGHE